MADDDHRQVPCPSCGYDLRGVPAVGDFYRCPECGGLTRLARMADARHRRNRASGRIVAGVLLALVLCIWLVLDSLSGPGEGGRLAIVTAGAIGGVVITALVVYAQFRWIRR